jgi:ABC-type nitrate/sulfonate/bicarbonate transport system substrate-binding protein
LANAIGRGAKIRIVAGRDELKPGCSDAGALYYRRSRFPGGLDDPRQWEGSRVALSNNNLMTEFYLDQILRSKGLAASSVQLSRMGMAESVAAASTGHIDAFFGSGRPEFLSGGLPKDVTRSDLIMSILGRFQYTYVVYGAKMLDGNPETGAAFLRAYLRGVRRFAAGDTPRFLDELAARMHQNADLLKAECRDNISTEGEIRVEDIRRWLAWAAAKKYLTQPVTAEQMIDTRFQRAAPGSESKPGSDRPPASTSKPGAEPKR